MDITFQTRKLKKLCTQEKEGIRRLGDRCARKLRARLQDLDAADALGDLREVPVSGRLHELTGDRAGQFAMSLVEPYRLIFEPTDRPPPLREDGGLDWDRITAITIVEIVDYH